MYQLPPKVSQSRITGESDPVGLVSGRGDPAFECDGQRVELADHPKVLDAAVIGVDDPDFGKRLRAFIVPAVDSARPIPHFGPASAVSPPTRRNPGCAAMHFAGTATSAPGGVEKVGPRPTDGMGLVIGRTMATRPCLPASARRHDPWSSEGGCGRDGAGGSSRW
ncbi:hypothetical protein HGB45_03865 [Nocardia cerradoensis]|nr:hypothetical protein [Nocardia cerradoensis]